ncbi:MAG: hypothetical protein K6G21_11095 [Treponema sp.]|nr:hypothetical protein [Treponema sp.]
MNTKKICMPLDILMTLVSIVLIWHICVYVPWRMEVSHFKATVLFL